MRCTRRLIRCQVRLGEVAFACFGKPNRTRTFQWLAGESTSGLDRACVLLPLFQPREPLPRENSCGLETWHYLFVLYNPPCSFPLPLLFRITPRIRGTECLFSFFFFLFFCGTVALWAPVVRRTTGSQTQAGAGSFGPAGGALPRNSWHPLSWTFVFYVFI